MVFSCPQQLNRWPCHSLTHWLTHWLRVLLLLTLQSDPRDLWPLRHLIRMIRKHDLTNIMTILILFWQFWFSFENVNFFWKFLTIFNNFWQFLRILHIFDLTDLTLNFQVTMIFINSISHFSKMSTISHNFTSYAMSLTWSLYLYLSLFLVFGHGMSPHHSGQICQRSQVSSTQDEWWVIKVILIYSWNLHDRMLHRPM